jgi:hypothetical protein
MSLSYRGIPYEKPSLALDTDLGEVKGKYRGQMWHQHYPRPIPQLLAKPAMTYRGVAIANTTNQACPVPVRPLRKVVSNELGQVHFDNIRKSLEKRLAIAQAREDQSLVQLLEREYEQLMVL